MTTKNITKAAMFPNDMDHMGLNEYQNNTGWNSWNALGPMGQGFPSGGMQGAFGSNPNPYATQPNIQGNEAIMQSQQQLNNMNGMAQQHPQLNNYIKGAAQNNEKIQRSATGEDNGVSYKLRDEDHATGSSAWDSLSKFMKTGTEELPAIFKPNPANNKPFFQDVGELIGGASSLVPTSKDLGEGLGMTISKYLRGFKKPQEKAALSSWPIAAGGLAGLGLPYLLDNNPSQGAVLSSMAGGTALGGLASYLRDQSGAKKQRKQLKSKKQEELTEQELRDLAVLDDLAAPALKEAGFTDFQAGFYGALLDTGVDDQTLKDAADDAAFHLGPELCAELHAVDFDVLEKFAQQKGLPGVANKMIDFMTDSSTRRAARKVPTPTKGPTGNTNWAQSQTDAIQDLAARNKAPFTPVPDVPVPQTPLVTPNGRRTAAQQARVDTATATPAVKNPVAGTPPKKPGMTGTDKALIGASVGVPTVVGGGLAMTGGGNDAGPAGATGAGGGAPPTSPTGPSSYTKDMNTALGDWGGVGKGINDVSNTLGADFLIDKILGEGQAAQMHPLLKVLLLAGGGMGIGGLLSGNNKMGLGGLGLAALPLLFQGTKGFGMMGGGDNKTAPDIDTSQISYTPNEALDNAWADKKLSAEEYNKLLKDPTALASAVSHDEFGGMAQQIINQTATRDSSGAHKPPGGWGGPAGEPTMGDNLVSLGGADPKYNKQLLAALAKPTDQITKVGPFPGIGKDVPGMGLSPKQAQLLLQKLRGMQAGTPTYNWNNVPVANTPPAPPQQAAVPPTPKPNPNTKNQLDNIGLK